MSVPFRRSLVSSACPRLKLSLARLVVSENLGQGHSNASTFARMGTGHSGRAVESASAHRSQPTERHDWYADTLPQLKDLTPDEVIVWAGEGRLGAGPDAAERAWRTAPGSSATNGAGGATEPSFGRLSAAYVARSQAMPGISGGRSAVRLAVRRARLANGVGHRRQCRPSLPARLGPGMGSRGRRQAAWRQAPRASGRGWSRTA